MAEREWREASDMRPSVAGLTLVVLCGAALRFWAIDRGIPAGPESDEPTLVAQVVRMMQTGDFNPHFFDHPTLYLYVQLVVACARFLTGAMTGLWRALDQVGPEDFYVWGRAVTALAGTLTVWLVYQIGMRWGARHALLAAGLVAVMPLHVRESHYVLTDVPATLLIALTFLLALRAHEKGVVAAFAWAGAAAGLAAATNYHGAVALLLPLVAAGMSLDAQPSRLRCALAAVGACLGVFLAAAPYTWLDLPAFLNTSARILSDDAASAAPGASGWQVGLRHLRQALQWPGLALMFVGLALGIERAVRGPGRVRWTLLVAFPLVHFSMVAAQGGTDPPAMVPLVPFVGLLVAIAVVSGVSLLRRFDIPRAPRTALIAGLTIAALLPPALQAIAVIQEIAARGPAAGASSAARPAASPR